MKAADVRTVGVIGCGIMGSGIAEVLARAGRAVVFVEANDELVERGRARIESSTSKALERGKLSEADREVALSRIRGVTDVAELADVDLVIEAATENLEAKREVFRRLDEVTRPEVVLASNTSSLPISELGAATKRPDRVIGMHFFNPPPVMALIELIAGLETSEETLSFAQEFADRIGKTTVRSKDRAGFIVNMLLVPYLNAAVRLLDEGVATREDIDTAIHLGLGHPMGPLTLIDLIGLDTMMHVGNVLFEEFHEPLYAPPPLLKRMVSAGQVGRKSGRGFYEYPT
ncbi:MAG: 3-hydroxybutyryl-CoA dehydrogenase [Actinomycetota bacterium]|nr:3-hydroxybutyryl-CoA dehydrogenase [Actinomycetota bacterium]